MGVEMGIPLTLGNKQLQEHWEAPEAPADPQAGVWSQCGEPKVLFGFSRMVEELQGPAGSCVVKARRLQESSGPLGDHPQGATRLEDAN